jgi:hypothetical protein
MCGLLKIAYAESPPGLTIRSILDGASACAVDPKRPQWLAYAQNDLICEVNRVQHRTADSIHIGGSARVDRNEG